MSFPTRSKKPALVALPSEAGPLTIRTSARKINVSQIKDALRREAWYFTVMDRADYNFEDLYAVVLAEATDQVSCAVLLVKIYTFVDNELSRDEDDVHEREEGDTTIAKCHRVGIGRIPRAVLQAGSEVVLID